MDVIDEEVRIEAEGRGDEGQEENEGRACSQWRTRRRSGSSGAADMDICARIAAQVRTNLISARTRFNILLKSYASGPALAASLVAPSHPVQALL